MLCLSRKIGERIIIGGSVVVEVLGVRSANNVSIGITAPSDVTILREELLPDAARQTQEETQERMYASG